MKSFIQIILKSIILISFLFFASCDQKKESEKKSNSENIQNDQKILSLGVIKRIFEGEESAKITIITYDIFPVIQSFREYVTFFFDYFFNVFWQSIFKRS